MAGALRLLGGFESRPVLLLVPSSGQSGNVEAQKAVTAGKAARVGRLSKSRAFGASICR